MMKLLHAAVSHDLMHPINNIEFFVDSMFHECRNGNFEKASMYLQYILDSCKLASSRMQDLLDQNLIEHKAFVPRQIEFSPHAAITRIKNLVEAHTNKYDIQIVDSYRFDQDKALVGDVDRIQQVLLNLLSNSRKFVPKQ
jgi:signal transduction histidine kinase